MIPTKRGIGVQLWGTYDDLNALYDSITEYFLGEDRILYRGDENRLKLLSSFSYEIRKAYEGARLKRNGGHYAHGDQEYLGTQASWVHILFVLAGLRFASGFHKVSKLDAAWILQLEYWTEHAMRTYDEKGAKELVHFVDGTLYGGNEYIYHYMRSTNAMFIMQGGGKRAFRYLPRLLERGVPISDEYEDYKKSLETEAKKLNCSVDDMEIDDDHVNYEIPW